MAQIAESLTQLIGNTPLLRLKAYEKAHGLKGNLIAKLEYFNPCGSIKDRVGYNMIQDAVQKGKVDGDTLIIEPTSGNTGSAWPVPVPSKGVVSSLRCRRP